MWVHAPSNGGRSEATTTTLYPRLRMRRTAALTARSDHPRAVKLGSAAHAVPKSAVSKSARAPASDATMDTALEASDGARKGDGGAGSLMRSPEKGESSVMRSSLDWRSTCVSWLSV